MRKIISVGLSFLVLTALISFGTWKLLHALGKHYAKDMPKITHYESWASLLELNEKQKKEVAGLEIEFKKDLEKIEPELAKAKINLCRLLMEESSFDAPPLRLSAQKVADLSGEQEARTAVYLLSLKKILSPVQQKKLFQTLMKDLCVHCRAHMTTTKIKEDLCGMCVL